MSIHDAIGHIYRVPFEDVYVPDLGSLQWFQADIQVEVDGGDYHFVPMKIYTHQIDGEGDSSFLPAKTDTAIQLSIETALKEFVSTSPMCRETMEEAANEEGLSHWILEAA